MKDLNYFAQEIIKGRNPETNLERYSAGMAALYHGLAYIKLSMNYYTVYEMHRDGVCEDARLEELLARFHDLAGALPAGSLTTAPVEQLRNELIAVMEVVTAYVDRFRIYEYVLNRIEYRFTTQKPDLTYYNTHLTNDLMHYILSDQDQVVIHSKISAVVEQLPMRLTRQKFYEYLREAFSLYHGAQKGTVEDFAYALRTTAMAYAPDGFDHMFPQLYDLYRLLAEADYTGLDEAAFRRLSDALKLGVEKVTACADSFVLLTQMVNDLYTIVLTQPVALGPVAETAAAQAVIADIAACSGKGAAVPETKVLAHFMQFEGKQERILSVLSQCDHAVSYALQQYPSELETYGQRQAYEILETTMKLQSGSDFMALKTEPSKAEVAPDDYADQVCEALISRLDELFQQLAQPVRRAVMAEVLAQLPVFFQRPEEIHAYINVSLLQCRDAAEQTAVMEILKMIMADTP